jgi:acyl-CoA thioester hydrolase
MERYSVPLSIRWADIDANRHLRHSVYYDFAAAMRMNYLNSKGLTTEKLIEYQVGPILFREEAIFKREVRLEDKVNIDFTILKCPTIVAGRCSITLRRQMARCARSSM